MKWYYNDEQRSYIARGSGSLHQQYETINNLYPCLKICIIPTFGQDMSNVAEGQGREKMLPLIPSFSWHGEG